MSILPFKVKAVFEYTSPHEDDLHFPNGQIITVTDEEDADWYSGEYVDGGGVKQEGIFPRNFVEKYEPTAPPRPNRAVRPKKEVDPPPATASESPSSPVTKAEPAIAVVQKPNLREVSDPAPTVPEPTPPAAAKPVVSPPPVVQPKPVQTSPKPAAASPPTGEKPGGTFRDRIAAFNKSAAPPPTPFKPGGLSQGGSSFIKKPFVAPPPSKDAYVPPPREQAPAKIYRRDEDPEIAERETENQENAERAGLMPTTNEDGEEDQPKPTSLKERIALLQKQQQEQAARHADAAQKKEKPKRPAKKRADSYGTNDGYEEAEGPVLERQESHDTVGRKSLDSMREEPTPARSIPRHKTSRGPPALPVIQARDSFGDGNDADMSGAGDETEEPEELSTGRDDSDEKPRSRAPGLPMQLPTTHMNDPVAEEDDEVGRHEAETGEAKEDEEEEEEEDEEEKDDVDPEVRRKEEIRARMAKMSGGMGMMGMLGPQIGMPMPSSAPAFKKKKPAEKVVTDDHGAEDPGSSAARAPPVPMALPGMSRVRSPVEAHNDQEEEMNLHEDVPIAPSRTSYEAHPAESNRPTPVRAPSNRPAPHSVNSSESLSAPPVPGGRPAPPPIPTDTRPTPSTLIMPQTDGSESDDEMSLHDSMQPVKTPTAGPPARELPPRPPGLPARQLDGPGAPKSPESKKTSYFGSEDSPISPTTPGTAPKRTARPPPIPSHVSGASPTQTRAPPPPPPGHSLSRSSTGDVRSLPSPKHAPQDDSEEEITEYEGDYDTDIASAVPHKDALTAHANYSSENDGPAARSPVTSSPPPLPLVAAPRAVPPLPPVTAPRAVPPPPPLQPAPSRQSTDMRAAPPPPPREQRYDQDEDDDEYDPYKYTSPKQGIPIGGVAIGRVPTVTPQTYEEDDLYSASPPPTMPPPPQERAAPPPPPREAAPPPASRAPQPSRQSMEGQKQQTPVRRSTEPGRMSMDSGFVANDIDLAQISMWWKKSDGIPPVFEGRKDILYESEESTNTKRGGKSTTTKDLYILFQDYSQTIIHVRFDPQNPSDAVLEQRHEPPPSKPRQDQLEESHERFGRKILDAVAGKKDTVVGDGMPQSLVTDLLKPFNDALLPVGSRAYGALVYANMANASTSQFDEIRPGDIITLRNAKLQGKHGAMHAKYSMDVGAGNGHVGVVAEWDGTKKKVRAWEQGRESKKVRLESYKLDDLRSGEVKIWRVMPRSWVGWEGEN